MNFRSLLLSISCIVLLSNFAIAQQNTDKYSLADKKVLWLGDSITQAGDYVTFVQYFLNKQFPKKKFDIICVGLASETISGLSEKAHPFPRPCVIERLDRALSLTKPDIIVACYGMNDGIYHPQSDDRMNAFQNGINKLISASKSCNAKLILLTPPPFDKTVLKNLLPKDAPDFSYAKPYENYDSVLEVYAKWEETLSPNDALVIDLHTPITNNLEKARGIVPQFSFTRHGIHPDTAGHLLIAEIILNGLGISIPFDANLNKNVSDIQADPLYAPVKKLRESRSAAWLGYIGYTRGSKVKTDSITDAEQSCATLQNQIDQIRNPETQ